MESKNQILFHLTNVEQKYLLILRKIIMKASILTIGDEILNGSTLDTNATFMADNAIKEGLEIVNILSVSDQRDGIIDGLAFLEKTSDFIFITGGLGPTKDDITVKTLAEYLNVPLVFDKATHSKITKMLQDRFIKDIQISEESCSFPKGVELLTNKKGTAPCMWLNSKQAVLISMPGVPLEMKQLFKEEVLPKIKKDFKLNSIINKYIMTAGIWESIIAKEIIDIENNLPEDISLAYLPKLGQVKLRLTGNNVSDAEVQKHADLITETLKENVYSFNEEDDLAKVIGEKLLQAGKTLATAESCTGGKVSHKITSNAGSSAYFKGSVVSYSNEVKIKTLGVKSETLETFGAVSEQTVVEMAQGAIKALNTDYSVAISGIAGPTGGTLDKPVGTVWIAVASKAEWQTKKFHFWPFRKENIELSSIAALNMLKNFI
ncbi:MAG: nicotinamide-nucleotide amidase [Planctomycetota bacterium]